MGLHKLRHRPLAGGCRRLLGMALLAAAACGIAAADDDATPSTSEMVQQLKPHPATRGIVITAAGAVAAAAPPSIELAVHFEFNSAQLAGDAAATLDRLGSALSDPVLANCRFRIAGHTDATGRADYNQRLSEHRAAAVRDYLMQHYSIDPQRLSAIGLGSSELRDPQHPGSAVNRRVEITNLGTGG